MKVKDIIQFTEWMPNPQRPAETPGFSIMMPTYRRFASGHLTRAIQAVLAQTYRNFELIMIDDGSVDGSFDEIQRFMKLDSRIHCLHHPRNVGLPAVGCYEAFLKSRAEYLMFCFDDTEYQKDALEQVEQYISKHKPKIAFGYIDIKQPGTRGRDIFLGKERISQSNLVLANFFPNLGAILHRNVPHEIGFLDPHFAIARLTDWDYWRRAAKVYELHYSGIYIGTEFGLVTGNSLGSSYPLNTWTVNEWMGQDRNVALIPGHFEEYDVQTIPDGLSNYSRLVLEDISGFFEKKFWYQAQGSLTVANKGPLDGQDEKPRFLVIANAQSASVTLTFEFIPGAEQSIRYVSPIHHKPEDMIDAKAVIFTRDLLSSEYQRWVKIARHLGIPHYYYVDDNLILLSEEIRRFRKYTIARLREELASFHGVLVPSQPLAEFFTENSIHPRVYTFPPILPPAAWLDHAAIPEKPAGAIRIGFMGGAHRHGEFIGSVLPAIKRLAMEQAVELVTAGDLKLSPTEYPQLKVYQFPFDMSYRLTLGRMRGANPDILVHAGSVTGNNSYKTHNVLLNAWALKAFPILASQPPYEEVEKLGLGLLCSNAEDWNRNLQRVILEPDLPSQVGANLDRYVRENFSGRQNRQVLKSISQDCPSPGAAVIESRYRLYIDMLEKETQQLFNWAAAMAQGRSRLKEIVQQNRSWLLPANSPQERLARFLIKMFYSG
jgi:glycosyltransferase involved in cell wall biosynthesis